MNDTNHHDIAMKILKNVWLEKTNCSNVRQMATLAPRASRTI
jgi:hypothetical protein